MRRHRRKEQPSDPKSDIGDITHISEGDKDPDDNTNSNNKKSIPKKVTISLALDEFVVSEVRKDAENSQRSLNAMINQILERYIKYYRLIEQHGRLILPPPHAQLFLKEVDETKLTAAYKKQATDMVPALITQSGIPLTLDSIVKYSFEELSVFGGAIKSVKKYIDERDGKTCLYFLHDYDIKWSRILSAAYAAHIKYLLHYHTAIKVFSEGFELKILESNPL